MRDACKRFGVSDVALGKVCKRLNVPRPKRGYWQRRAVGRVEPIVPLPSAAPGAPTHWEGTRSLEPDPVAPVPGDAPTIAIEPIPVPAVLEKPHPALTSAMPAMLRASTDVWDHRRWNGLIPVLASKATLDRALRIMNALLHALESRGCRFEVTGDSEPGEPWRRGQAGVWVGDLHVGLSLFERWKKTRSDDSWRSVVYVPNGHVSIRIHGNYRPFREWTDTKATKIESRLHEVIPAVLARAEELRAEKVEAERRREADRQAEIRRAEAERRRREEEQQVGDSRAMLAAWREARDLRAFIDETRAIVAAAGRTVREGSRLDSIIKWSLARAERLDPLTELREEIAEKAEAAGRTP
jgi:hypothetical protein